MKVAAMTIRPSPVLASFVAAGIWKVSQPKVRKPPAHNPRADFPENAVANPVEQPRLPGRCSETKGNGEIDERKRQTIVETGTQM